MDWNASDAVEPTHSCTRLGVCYMLLGPCMGWECLASIEKKRGCPDLDIHWSLLKDRALLPCTLNICSWMALEWSASSARCKTPWRLKFLAPRTTVDHGQERKKEEEQEVGTSRGLPERKRSSKSSQCKANWLQSSCLLGPGASCQPDGLDHPQIDKLAKIGARGKYPGNMQRDMSLITGDFAVLSGCSKRGTLLAGGYSRDRKFWERAALRSQNVIPLDSGCELVCDKMREQRHAQNTKFGIWDKAHWTRLR